MSTDLDRDDRELLDTLVANLGRQGYAVRADEVGVFWVTRGHDFCRAVPNINRLLALYLVLSQPKPKEAA